MRDIKFRAWDLDTKTMVQDVIICNQGNQPMRWDKSSIAPIDIRGLGMQFTGLQDVNGVDIYEGDILHQLDPVSWCPQTVCFDKKSASYSVGMEQLTSSTISYIELIIVGNIHEDSELLS